MECVFAMELCLLSLIDSPVLQVFSPCRLFLLTAKVPTRVSYVTCYSKGDRLWQPRRFTYPWTVAQTQFVSRYSNHFTFATCSGAVGPKTAHTCWPLLYLS